MIASLLAVWAAAFLAGWPIARLTGRRYGLPGVMLFGLAYWSAAVYVLPFRGGLDVAFGSAVVGSLLTLRRPRIHINWATGILTLACASFSTLLLFNELPFGMDATMHTTAARLIAEQRGLPTTYAPIVPDLFFPAVNLGLPTLAAVAIRFASISPPFAFMAAEQFAFSAFVFGTYLLVRRFTTPTPAAIFATFAVWTSRNAQETIGWGGVPTIAGVALGLFATRLLLDALRRPTVRGGIVLGIVVGAMPLAHGISAAVWVYTFAPVALVGELIASRRWRIMWKSLVPAAVVTSGIVGAYLAVGRTNLGEAELAWTRAWQADYAPAGEGWRLLATAPNYVKSYGGSVAVWAGVVAVCVLLWRRRFGLAIGCIVVYALLSAIVANAKVWLLPASFLLYPERAVYFMTPLAAVALAGAWQNISHVKWTLLLALILFGFAAPKHWHGYQKIVTRPMYTADECDFLAWAGRELDASRDFVVAPYGTIGASLPGSTGIACSGWHVHAFALAEAERAQARRVRTHQIVYVEREPLPAGEVVFRTPTIVVVKLAR